MVAAVLGQVRENVNGIMNESWEMHWEVVFLSFLDCHYDKAGFVWQEI